MRMLEPTSAKWQVPVECAKVFLFGLETAPGKEGIQDSMLETFAQCVLLRMRGTGDVARPQDAGTHPHCMKWEEPSALFASPVRLVGLYFYLGMWQFFGARHEFCLAHARASAVSRRHFIATRWLCGYAQMPCGIVRHGPTPRPSSPKRSFWRVHGGAELSTESQMVCGRICGSAWLGRSRQLRRHTSSGVPMCGDALAISSAPSAMRSIERGVRSSFSYPLAMGVSWARRSLEAAVAQATAQAAAA